MVFAFKYHYMIDDAYLNAFLVLVGFLFLEEVGYDSFYCVAINITTGLFS